MQINEFTINNTSIYHLSTQKFKTNIFGFSFVLPLSKKYLPELTLLAQMFTKQTKSFKTEREFALKLNELYDTQILYNFEKKGKVLQVSIYLHIISDKYIQCDSNLTFDSFNLFKEVVFSKKIITKELLEKEKKIYTENYESKMSNVLYESSVYFYQKMFQNENYLNHLDTSIEDINNVTIESIQEAYEILMSSTKFGFVIGDLNNERIKKIFEDIPETINKKYELTDLETKEIVNVCFDTISCSIPQSILIMGYRTNITVNSKLYFAMCLLNKYLGGGFDSIFIRKIREEHNLVYAIGSEYDWYKGIMIINSGFEYDDFKMILELVQECINDIKNGQVDIELLDAIKKQMISEQMEAEDNLISLVEIINQKYFYPNKIISNELKIDRINKVTKEELIEVSKHLELDTVLLVGKGESNDYSK